MDLFGMVKQIVDFVVQIQGAMKNARSNAEDCDTIEEILGILTDIPEQLRGKPAGTLWKATKRLESVKSCASEIVDKCKHKGYLRRTWEADDISKDLARLRSDIQLILQTLSTAVTVRLLADVADLKSILLANPDVQLRKEREELVQKDRDSTENASSQIENRRETQKTTENASSHPNVPQDQIHQENNRLGDIEALVQPSLSDKESSSVSKVVDKVQPVAVSAAPFQVSRSMTEVTSIDVHPTKKWIVTGHEGGYFSIWDYQQQKTVEYEVNKVPDKKPNILQGILQGISQSIKEKAPTHWVCSTTFIVQEKWLAVGDGGGYIYIYAYMDTELWEVKKFKAHDTSVDTLCVHPTEPYLLSSSAYGNKIKLWDWSRDWKKIQEFDVKSVYSKGVRSLKFNPRDTNTFACVTDDGRIMVGNINSSSSLATIRLKTKILEADYLFADSTQHLMVTRSASSSASPNCEILDLATGNVVHTLGVSEMRRVAGHPTLPIVVSASDDGTIYYWDASTYRRVKMVQIPDREPDDLVLVKDINGLTRLVANFKTTVAIMEINLANHI